MTNAGFNPFGIIVSSPSGDLVLNAGPNMTIYPSGNLVTFSAEIPSGVVINNTNAWQPPAISDVNAPNNSVYFSKDANKLVYKAADSSINPLY